MVKLKDGRLALTYGFRHAPYGIRARLSEDKGKTWSPEIILRDDGGNWDLGYPRTIQRDDGGWLPSTTSMMPSQNTGTLPQLSGMLIRQPRRNDRHSLPGQ